MVRSETFRSQNSHQTETSQPIRRANQLTGFCMTQIPTESHLQTDYGNDFKSS